ncbi:Coiled-coil and C2 domain-containing protein 2A, partial [Nowakowskiella sp. JEL0078]
TFRHFNPSTNYCTNPSRLQLAASFTQFIHPSTNQLQLSAPSHTLDTRLLDTPTGTYTLVFDVIGVVFEDHRLMLDEARVAKELGEVVEVIEERRRVGVVDFLSEKLKVGQCFTLKNSYSDYLKNYPDKIDIVDSASGDTDGIYVAKPVTRYTLEKDLEKVKENEKNRKNNEEFRKKAYREDIRNTRLLRVRDTERQMDRLLEFKALQTWERLKIIRSEQGFVSTNIRLIIRTMQVDTALDKEYWDAEISEELSELSELHNITQQLSQANYQTQLLAYNSKHTPNSLPSYFSQDEVSIDSDPELLKGYGNSTPPPEIIEELPKQPKASNRSRSLTSSGIKQHRQQQHQSESRASERKKNRAHSVIERGRVGVHIDSDEEPQEVARPSKADLEILPNARHKIIRKEKKARTVTDSKSIDLDLTKKRKKSSLTSPKEVRKVNDTSKTHTYRLKRVENSLEDLPPVRPKIVEFNVKKARKAIVKRLNESCRPVGAPILQITCSYNETVTSFQDCPKFEQNRRQEVESTNISIKLFYNDKEITTTKSVPLDIFTLGTRITGKVQQTSSDQTGTMLEVGRNPLFTVISVEVREAAENIRAIIIENSVLGDTFLGEIFVPIPEPTENIGIKDTTYRHLQFSGPKFERIREIVNEASMESWVTGKLWMNVSWGIDENGCSLGPSRNTKKVVEDNMWSTHGDPLKTVASGGLINLRKLM